jgi:hypothetical protein
LNRIDIHSTVHLDVTQIITILPNAGIQATIIQILHLEIIRIWTLDQGTIWVEHIGHSIITILVKGLWRVSRKRNGLYVLIAQGLLREVDIYSGMNDLVIPSLLTFERGLTWASV